MIDLTGVVVRADHCRPVHVKAIERKRGRPRVRERRGQRWRRRAAKRRREAGHL